MLEVKPAFIYLYPQQEILDFEIENRSRGFDIAEKSEFELRLEKAGEEEKQRLVKEILDKKRREFKEAYSQKLNQCIDLRYRQKGFSINYALLDDGKISDVFVLQSSDRIIYVGMDGKTHRTLLEDKSYPYPNQDYILNQLGNLSSLRVAGFHLWDCVQRLAKRAHERGIDVLVDEDLTELFGFTFQKPKFRTDVYPSLNPREEMDDGMLELFMERRKDKPWMFKDYK